MIPDRFEYRPGATFVGSTVDDLLEGGSGRLPGLRAPLADPPALTPGSRRATCRATCLPRPRTAAQDSVEVDTHAWVEALLPGADGDEPVWIGADPTNRRLAGEEHVKIGHGRFYGDVAPIRGVYRGGRRAPPVTMRQMCRYDPPHFIK